jgi:hypothetical protein
VKMYAYAQMGKPILGTPVQELLTRPEVVTVCHTPDQFASALRGALDATEGGTRRAELEAFASQNNWAVRAQSAWRILAAMVPGEVVPPAADRAATM